MCVLPVCMSVYHLCTWYPQRPEEGVSPLGLELWVVVNHLVGAGN